MFNFRCFDFESTFFWIEEEHSCDVKLIVFPAMWSFFASRDEIAFVNNSNEYSNIIIRTSLLKEITGILKQFHIAFPG